MTPDHFFTLSARQSKAQNADRRRGTVDPVTASPVLVGQVFGDPTVPTATGVYFSAHPVDVSGPEVESGPGVLTPDTSRAFLVDVVGSTPALAGDYLICRFVGYRWVAERLGLTRVGGVSVAGCPCASSPATLHMTSSAPDSNNGIFQSAALQYGPTPAALLPVVISSSSYISTSSFIDIDLGVPFRYYLACSSGSYVLTRVYVTSPLGSPFRDSIRYRWIVGIPGNTCTPFLISNGQIFQGGDPSCVVTVSE